jgi:hypothetical protein
MIRELQTAMFVIVAPVAEVFPITAIPGIIVVVSVAVVDGKQMKVGQVELTGALCTDPAMELQ